MKKVTSIMIATVLLAVSGSVLADGQKTYQTSCQACHATGAAGAPKFGDKAAWAPRIATGVDAMLAVAIKGKGAMPPKGACASCSDDDLKAAIEYMVSQSQ
jgi:cytochrome c5